MALNKVHISALKLSWSLLVRSRYTGLNFPTLRHNRFPQFNSLFVYSRENIAACEPS